MRRVLVKAAGALVIISALAIAFVYLYLRRSLPETNGTITVAGIQGTVEIVRDADAIPHVFATNKADAFFGLGYVHAQDRLWQMEFQRRIGFGRLSEVFGSVTVPQDTFLRTVGFGRAARAAWARMPEWAKAQIDAYVAGVNAFIDSHHGSRLPPEFSLLRFEPERWSGPDVVVWVKMMAWDLSANYTFEILRDDLTRAVGAERMAQLMPPYAMGGLSIVGGDSSGWTESGSPNSSRATTPHAPERPARREALPAVLDDSARRGNSAAAPLTDSMSPRFAEALTQGDPTVADFLLGNSRAEALGSNNWVVDGTLTASGKPMLANDPHLSAKTPSTWYLAHVVGGDFDAIGATLPGAPAIAIGRNRFIAWGETNVAADVEDLFRERLDADGTSAEYKGTFEPIKVIPEPVAVKGGAPVQVNVRVTRHGPLISDAINVINAASPRTARAEKLAPLALRWTALDDDDSTLESFLKLNEARNWEQFTTALRSFVTPSQNFVYADVEGHIGYYAPGRIPHRAGGDGSRPTNGWTGEGEWIGWVPFDGLPHVYDPPNHFIVTANHRPEPANYPYLLGLEWVEPYRAQRINDLLQGRTKLTSDDFAQIQADTLSLHALALKPVLLAHVHNDSETAAVVSLLTRWNGEARGDWIEPAIFSAWFHELAPSLAGDELGQLLTDSYAGRFTFITRFVVNTLNTNDERWCDDVRTAKKESCDDTVTAALQNAIARLTARLGSDRDRWRWDSVHRAMFPHQGLDSVKLLRPLLSRSVPNGGDWSTVNVGPVAADQLYEQHSVAGYRQIIDLAAANTSRFMNDVGESGHPLSKHYDDYLPAWRDVRHKLMRLERADVDRGAIGRLKLEPQR